MNFVVFLRIFLAIALLNTKPCMNYSYMVPQESCYDMYPKHNATHQLNASPYKILLDSVYYYPYEEFKVTIVSTNRAPFSGFLIQARVIGTSQAVGAWNLDPAKHSTQFIGVLRCSNNNVFAFYYNDYSVI